MKKKSLDTTAEFRIKRRQKKSTKLWQKILIGLSLAILILAITLVVMWLIIKYLPSVQNDATHVKRGEITYYLMDEDGNFYESDEGVYLPRPVETYELDESLEFKKDENDDYLLDEYGNFIRTDFDESKNLGSDNIIRYLKDANGGFVESPNGIYVQVITVKYELDYSLDFKINENGEYILDECGNRIRVEAPDKSFDEESNDDGALKIKDKTYNFLVLGCDRAGWLTDVIMIATYDIPQKDLSIMQVPRDTYVFVNDTVSFDDDGNISYENFDGIGNDKPMKINAVAWHGGLLAENELNRLVSLTKKNDSDIKKICKDSFLDITADELEAYMSASGSKKKNLAYNIKLDFGIEYLQALISCSFGTPIDFYAHMNLNGFANIVNAIDGVDVYVPDDMDYDDPLQNPPLSIHLKKGQQHLNGNKAEQFIRFRYGYAAADIARIDAQKIFMTAFIKKVFSLEGLMNIDKLVEEVTKNLTTNINLSDAIHFATNAMDLDFSEILMLTLPGEPKYVGNVSYYCVDKKTLIEYVNAYHNKFTTDLEEDYFCVTGAAERNTSTTPLTAEDIKNKQPNLGFMH